MSPTISRLFELEHVMTSGSGEMVHENAIPICEDGAQESLNVRAAFLAVMGDLLSSIGTIVAALIILATGWTAADALISALIGVFMLPRAWVLLRSVIDVLLESAPGHLNIPQIEAAIRAVPGVDSVHDMHLWSITSGFDAMSGHVRSNGRPSEDVLHDLRTMLRDRFGIEHVTLQVEAANHADDGACCVADPRCFVPAGAWPRVP